LARRLIQEFDIRGASPGTAVGTLSGGNMQKVVIAREFDAQPTVLLVSQPTRGVDVGAMEFVHNALVSARDRGAAVLLLSADLNEVMSLSDRLLVMYRGAVAAQFTHDDMTETAVGLAMAGVAPDAATVAEAEAEHEKIAALVSSTHAAKRLAPVDPSGPPSEPPKDPTPTPRPTTEPKADTVSGTWMRDVAAGVFTSAAQPVIAVALSLLIGVGIILAIGSDPIAAYNELFFSSFTSPQGIGALIAQLIPLLILSSAVNVSFRAGFFNIGGEGQLYVGAFAGAWVGFTFQGLPGPLLILLCLAAAFTAGLTWGFIPGALFAFWKVDIIVTTLMMSSIAVLLTAYFVTGPFKDPAAGLAGSPKVADSAMLPVFSPEYGIGLDLVLALVVAVALGLVLTRSVWGLKVSAVGQLNRFAAYTGISPKRMSMQVMAMSGAVSGLAGAIFVLGPNGGRFLQTFSPGYGFLGITVALLARLNPWAAIVAAVFYANMMAGSNGMQINTNVPYPLVNVLQGLIILLITAVFLVTRRGGRAGAADMTRSAATDGNAADGGEASSSTPTSRTDYASSATEGVERS